MPGDDLLDRALGDEPLIEALAQARAFGFLGPGPVHDHVRHAIRFARALGIRSGGPALDLGAGGGVPGLVLARLGVATPWTFLDSHRRRTAFLATTAAGLALHDVEVVTARAEEAGRESAYRGAFALVVARSFGPPAVTAECAVPFLRVGGHLAVSEPPGGTPERWPPAGLAVLGLTVVDTADPGIAVSRLERPAPARFPRRVGVPTKRPLF